MVKDIDPQFEEERKIINFPDENGGIDGWAMIQIEKRKRAEGKPLYHDPLLAPEEMK